ncbi:NAD(P)-binding protein [Schizophyllum commune Loenen D]|nr:NAD(P)-binding protein [Schizophyllum commune Loenen D]
MACFDSSRLHNKTAIVTGASAGIGAEAGGNFATVKLDLSDRDQIARFWEKVPERLREVDILVNNAGFVLGWEHVGDIADEDVEKMFSINVFGLIAMTQLLIKDFKARNLGHIINIGSIGSREPYAGGAIYTATKHAVKAFTGSLLRELVNTRIRVSEVQPGLVDTELALIRFRGDKDAIAKLYDGLEPLTGQDVAEDIVWVASRPPHVNVAEVFVLPTYQASVTIKRRPGDQI